MSESHKTQICTYLHAASTYGSELSHPLTTHLTTKEMDGLRSRVYGLDNSIYVYTYVPLCDGQRINLVPNVYL